MNSRITNISTLRQAALMSQESACRDSIITPPYLSYCKLDSYVFLCVDSPSGEGFAVPYGYGFSCIY